MEGNIVGKYKIIRLIGEGGMASVYEAEHEMLGTKVAIKVLNPILSANAQIKERFRNEAKLMASLDHPNITKVIDFDEQPQQLSIVMEFLNGEDLNDKIKRNGPLTEKEITDVFSQTLSAFQYAHEKGIVHRDIKPSNIFILKNGHVKILDFGIAKLFGQGNEMTQTGTQMGTPIYMSPEQVKADKSIDHRSDIYSLGVTMFYAINGKPPYNSDTDSQFDIFNKIVYEPLPEFSAQNNHHLIVSKACEKNREERFQTCFEFLQAFSLTSLNPESNEKTIIDEKITNNKKEEKTILNVESDSNNQNVENSNFPNKAKNPNNKKKTISIITALALFILGVWGLFNFNDKTTDEKNNNASSTDNTKADTTSLTNPADTTQLSKQPKGKTTNEAEPLPAWFSNTKNRRIQVNGKIITVADSRYPKRITYSKVKGILSNGWRLPTKSELEAMYRKDYLEGSGWRYYLCMSNDLSDWAHYGMFFPRGEWVIDHAYFENIYMTNEYGTNWEVDGPATPHFVKE
jgi:serine/threonine protein kinase